MEIDDYFLTNVRQTLNEDPLLFILRVVEKLHLVVPLSVSESLHQRRAGQEVAADDCLDWFAQAHPLLFIKLRSGLPPAYDRLRAIMDDRVSRRVTAAILLEGMEAGPEVLDTPLNVMVPVVLAKYHIVRRGQGQTYPGEQMSNQTNLHMPVEIPNPHSNSVI